MRMIRCYYQPGVLEVGSVVGEDGGARLGGQYIGDRVLELLAHVAVLQRSLSACGEEENIKVGVSEWVCQKVY